MTRTVHYSEFRQLVRRFAPTSLIPFLAAEAARLDPQIGSGYGDFRSRSPWALAAIARDSILYGTEHRSAMPTEATLGRLFGLFNNAHSVRDRPSIAEIMTPIMYEQFPYQESEFEELSRVHALFVDPELGPELDWSEEFGVDLDRAVRAAMVLHAWVTHNGGCFDQALLDMDHMQEVFARVVPRGDVECVASALTQTIDRARLDNAGVPALADHLRRYSYNPLHARPLIDLGSAGTWAPQTMLVSRAMHPANLYYRGHARWGRRFTRALGERTEAYVGRLLSLLAGDNLQGEIVWDKGQRKSVDWIWPTDRAVILFECKSARLTLGARAGDGTLPDVAQRYLVKARQQLDVSADEIGARNPSFLQFVGPPIVGVTVTSEPFYLGNSGLVEYGTDSTIPSVALSLRDVEHWTAMRADDAVDALLDIVNDPDRKTWSFSNALAAHGAVGRNSILERAWQHYDFLDPRLEDEHL